MNDEPPSGSQRKRSDLALTSTRGLIDTRRLFYFYHIMKAGSFTAAETNLDVAQPALTRQMKQFERELGVALFSRDGRGVVPTAVGEFLYEHAGRILKELSDLYEDTRQTILQPGGRVRIAAPPVFSSTYLPEVIKRFNEHAPNVLITAIEAASGKVYDLLAAGDVDIAIVIFAGHTPKLTFERLYDEPMMLLTGAGYPVGKQRKVTPEYLEGVDLILPPAPHGTRELLDRYLGDKVSPLKPKIEADGLRLIKELVRDNKHGTILPKSACEPEISDGQLIGREFDPPFIRTTYMATIRDRPMTSNIATLSEVVRDVVQERLKAAK